MGSSVGTITGEEVQKYRRAFTKLDKDGTGKISLKKWLAVLDTDLLKELNDIDFFVLAEGADKKVSFHDLWRVLAETNRIPAEVMEQYKSEVSMDEFDTDTLNLLRSCHELFRKIDNNKSGYISLKEWFDASEDLTNGVGMDFFEIDEDGDRKLLFTELCEGLLKAGKISEDVMKAHEKEVRENSKAVISALRGSVDHLVAFKKQFDSIDADSSGKVSVNEWMKCKDIVVLELIDGVDFINADKNKDYQLSFTEMCNALVDAGKLSPEILEEYKRDREAKVIESMLLKAT